jgi:hypothetical protein
MAGLVCLTRAEDEDHCEWATGNIVLDLVEAAFKDMGG